MTILPDNPRRWIGAIFLTIAVMMVVLGQTIFEGHLREFKFTFMVYWIACFGFTLMAVLIAFLDVWIVRRKSRELQRELIEETWNKVQKEKARKQVSEGGNDPQRQV